METLTPEDQLIYRFLLERLPANERESFEERCFREPELLETVEATEEEMILRFLRGELNEPWKSWFEPVYFGSEARHARVREAKALLEAARSSRSREPLRRAAIGGLIAASAAGVVIYRGVQRKPEGVVSAELDPGALRRSGGGQVIDVSPSAATIRLLLKMPAGAPGGKYEVVLGTPEAPDLWRGVVETGQAAVRTPVEIPAPGLKTGDYILELRGGGQTAASYQFRMRRR